MFNEVGHKRLDGSPRLRGLRSSPPMQRGAIGVEHDWYAVHDASGDLGEVMPVLRTAVALIATVILVGMPVSVFAQNAAPPNAPAEKTIGVPSTPDATRSSLR